MLSGNFSLISFPSNGNTDIPLMPQPEVQTEEAKESKDILLEQPKLDFTLSNDQQIFVKQLVPDEEPSENPEFIENTIIIDTTKSQSPQFPCILLQYETEVGDEQYDQKILETQHLQNDNTLNDTDEFIESQAQIREKRSKASLKKHELDFTNRCTPEIFDHIMIEQEEDNEAKENVEESISSMDLIQSNIVIKGEPHHDYPFQNAKIPKLHFSLRSIASFLANDQHWLEKIEINSFEFLKNSDGQNSCMHLHPQISYALSCSQEIYSPMIIPTKSKPMFQKRSFTVPEEKEIAVNPCMYLNEKIFSKEDINMFQEYFTKLEFQVTDEEENCICSIDRQIIFVFQFDMESHSNYLKFDEVVVLSPFAPNYIYDSTVKWRFLPSTCCIGLIILPYIISFLPNGELNMTTSS